jgi:hypothetical protein
MGSGHGWHALTSVADYEHRWMLILPTPLKLSIHSTNSRHRQ